MPSYFLETPCNRHPFNKKQLNLQYGTILKTNRPRLQDMGREAEWIWRPHGHSEYQFRRDSRAAMPQATPQGTTHNLTTLFHPVRRQGSHSESQGAYINIRSTVLLYPIRAIRYPYGISRMKHSTLNVEEHMGRRWQMIRLSVCFIHVRSPTTSLANDRRPFLILSRPTSWRWARHVGGGLFDSTDRRKV